MQIAPPILGPLDFEGLQNRMILIEHDDEDCGIDLLSKVLNNKVNIIFQPTIAKIAIPSRFDTQFTGVVTMDSVAQTRRAMRGYAGIDYYIINRIDLMDLKFNKRERGSQVNAFLSMILKPSILSDANVIVTSAISEYKIREIADKFVNLRKQQTQ